MHKLEHSQKVARDMEALNATKVTLFRMTPVLNGFNTGVQFRYAKDDLLNLLWKSGDLDLPVSHGTDNFLYRIMDAKTGTRKDASVNPEGIIYTELSAAELASFMG